MNLYAACVLLMQTVLIAWSGHVLVTRPTDGPGFHIAMLFLNAGFGMVNIYNLVRA